MHRWMLSLLATLLGPLGVFASDVTLEYWATNEARVVKPAASAPASAPPTSRPATFDVTEIPLVITHPVVLRTRGADYTLDREGLYRLCRTEPVGRRTVTRQVILYSGDIWRFAGHLSRLYVYGTRHLDRSAAELETMAAAGTPLSLQCGSVAQFVHDHLASQKIQSRLVSCVANHDWDLFGDGHLLMEVYDPAEKRFILFDPTLGARFIHNGWHLDLLETTQLYRTGKRADSIEFLRAGSKVDPLMDYDAFFARGISDPTQRAGLVRDFLKVLRGDVDAIHHWYGRVMTIPLIGDVFVVQTDAQEALMHSVVSWKDFKRLSADEFRRQLYAGPAPSQ